MRAPLPGARWWTPRRPAPSAWRTPVVSDASGHVRSDSRGWLWVKTRSFLLHGQSIDTTSWRVVAARRGRPGPPALLVNCKLEVDKVGWWRESTAMLPRPSACPQKSVSLRGGTGTAASQCLAAIGAAGLLAEQREPPDGWCLEPEGPPVEDPLTGRCRPMARRKTDFNIVSASTRYSSAARRRTLRHSGTRKGTLLSTDQIIKLRSSLRSRNGTPTRVRSLVGW